MRIMKIKKGLPKTIKDKMLTLASLVDSIYMDAMDSFRYGIDNMDEILKEEINKTIEERKKILMNAEALRRTSISRSDDLFFLEVK